MSARLAPFHFELLALAAFGTYSLWSFLGRPRRRIQVEGWNGPQTFIQGPDGIYIRESDGPAPHPEPSWGDNPANHQVTVYGGTWAQMAQDAPEDDAAEEAPAADEPNQWGHLADDVRKQMPLSF